MLRKISDEHIGNHEASEVLDALKLTHTDIRVSALCNIIMPDILPELYSLSESVNGMVETSDFTFEYALQQAFMKDNGTIPWNLLKRALEDEITRRDNDGIDEDLWKETFQGWTFWYGALIGKASHAIQKPWCIWLQ